MGGGRGVLKSLRGGERRLDSVSSFLLSTSSVSWRLSQLGAKRQRRSKGGQDIIPAGSDRVLVQLKVFSSPRLLSACPPLGAGGERRRRGGGLGSRSARLPLSHPDVGGSVGSRSAGQLAGPRGSGRRCSSRSSSCCSGSLCWLSFLPLGSSAAAVTPIIRLPIPASAPSSLHLLSSQEGRRVSPDDDGARIQPPSPPPRSLQHRPPPPPPPPLTAHFCPPPPYVLYSVPLTHFHQ